MNNKAINLNPEKLDLANIVELRNKYQIGGWHLHYNGNKNPAKFKFAEVKPNTLKITVAGSTGWVRLMRPIPPVKESGIYSIALSLRSLTENPKSIYEPFIFSTRGGHRYDKHSKLTRRDGKYVTKLHMSDESPDFWIGFETTDKEIDLYVSHVNLEIIEGSVQLVQSLKDCTKIDLPILFTEPKCQSYKAVKQWNEEFQSRINKGELPFLMEYAAGLRRIEMPETFIRLMRYLVVKYSTLNRPHQATLAGHIKNALLISHDETLLELITQHCPELLLSLDVNTQTIAEFAKLDGESVEHVSSTLDKHAYFEHQSNPSRLFNMVHRETVRNNGYLRTNPQAYCALANAYASRSGCEASYLAFLNKFLSVSGMPDEIVDIDFGADNILSSVDLNPVKTITQGPLVSIMMSAFNAGDTIDYAIRSLLAQSYQNIEVLVCDDHSSDNTLTIAQEWAQKDSRVRVFRSNKNQGTYNIRNDLIREAKGEFLTFQDSDDYALPSRIEIQLETIASQQKALCIGNWVRVRPDGSFMFFQDGAVTRFCVVSVMAHRSVFERMPPFRSSLVAADTEFYELCKCYIGESEIAIEKRPLILGLWGEGSLTRQTDLTADHSGYVAQRRRSYAEVAARQRTLGVGITSDKQVTDTLKNLNIYREPAGITALSN